MVFHGKPWFQNHGFPWKTMVFHGKPWFFSGRLGWVSMDCITMLTQCLTTPVLYLVYVLHISPALHISLKPRRYLTRRYLTLEPRRYLTLEIKMACGVWFKKLKIFIFPSTVIFEIISWFRFWRCCL